MHPRTNAYDSLYREQTVDGWIDENTTAAENKWATSKTIFYAEQGNSEKYKELKALNEGKYESDRSTTILRSKIDDDIESFCNILEMDSVIEESVKLAFKEIGSELGDFGGKSYEKIILVVINLMHDMTLTQNNDINDRVIYMDEYKELMDVVGMSSKERRQLRNAVRSKLDIFQST